MASLSALSSPSVPIRGAGNALDIDVGNGRHVQLAGTKLGTSQLEIDGRILLIPQPSADPNDPLRWGKARKTYIAFIVCSAALLSNFLAAGPTVDMVNIAIFFTGVPPDVQKTSYLFSTTALFQGLGMFFWIPFINSRGTRPTYVITTAGYFLCIIWCVLTTSYSSELAGRIFLGFFAGGAECLGPIAIAQIFFLHERGRYMQFYQTLLSVGVCLGIVIDGGIVHNHGWKVMYWVALALVGLLLLLVVFTFPETSFNRLAYTQTHMRHSSDSPGPDPAKQHRSPTSDSKVLQSDEMPELEEFKSPRSARDIERPPIVIGSLGMPPVDRRMRKKTYVQELALFSGRYTDERFVRMLVRPFGLILLPAVFWAAWIFAITIGFLVAITSNFAVALGGPPYNFSATQAGMCFWGGVLGGLIGIPWGGHLGDWVAQRWTHKHGGVFQPEYRLLAIIPAAIAGPLALIFYGVGIQHGVHWMLPTVGLALLNLAIVSGTNIAMVVAIDIYKPVAGEVVVAILGFKAIFGFALSFGTNAWIDLEGYQHAFGEMAGISAFFFLSTLIFWFWGQKIREASTGWRITKWIAWDADRDDVVVS